MHVHANREKIAKQHTGAQMPGSQAAELKAEHKSVLLAGERQLAAAWERFIKKTETNCWQI